MKYIGHSKIYYHGSHGFKLVQSEIDPDSYTIYFDAGFSPIKLYKSVVKKGFVMFPKRFFDSFGKYDAMNAGEFIEIMTYQLSFDFQIEVEDVL